MGCSNPHPHGQVWSLSEVPSFPATELENLRKYSLQAPEPGTSSTAPKGPGDRPCLLCEYAHYETSLSDGERVVLKDDHWVALVPYWAVWPFEILRMYFLHWCLRLAYDMVPVLPYRRHIPSLLHLTKEEKISFASMIKQLTIRYDNLFSCSFAYSMGIHQRPIPSADHDLSLLEDDDLAHLHLHFNPPLVRSASIRKFLVGFVLFHRSRLLLTK